MSTRKIGLALVVALCVVGLAVWWLMREAPGDGQDRDRLPGDRIAADSDDDASRGTGEIDATADALSGEQLASSQEPSEPETPEDADEAEIDTRPVMLWGYVKNLDGEPVPDARLVAVDFSRWELRLMREAQHFNQDMLAGMRRVRDVASELSAEASSAETDAAGRYEFRGLEPSEYRLIVTHPDHLSSTDIECVVREVVEPVSPPGDDAPSGDPSATAASENGASEKGEPGTGVRVDVELVEGHSIAGRVVDRQGRPVVGAAVDVELAERAKARGMAKLMQFFLDATSGRGAFAGAATETGADGAFEVRGLDPRLQTLRVGAEGFALRTLPEIPPGTSGLLVRLEEAPGVSGRIVDAEGQPVPGARLALRTPTPNLANANPMSMMMADIDFFGERTRFAESDQEGRFELRATREGPHELVIEAEGFMLWGESLRIGDGVERHDDIVLKPALKVRGVVLTSDEDPISGAVVSVPVDQGAGKERLRGIDVTMEQATVETDERGRFEISSLPDGEYTIAVEAEGWAPTDVQGVRPGGEDVRVVLGEAFRLTGLVLDDETDEPIEGARARVFDGGRSRRREVTSDEEGVFVIDGLRPNSVEADGDETSINVHVMHPLYERSWQNIQQKPGELEGEVTVRMSGGKLLRGTVLTERGDVIEGARVSIEYPGLPTEFIRMSAMDDGGSLTATTDSEGEFELAARGMGMGPMGAVLVAQFPGYAKGRSELLEASALEQGLEDIEIILSQGVVLEGRITDTAGQPVPNAQVRAFQETKIAPQMRAMMALMPRAAGEIVYANREGEYRYKRFQVGTYNLEVSANGFATGRVKDVVVAESGTSTRDIVLDPGKTIEGRVVDQRDEPLQGIEVVAFLALEQDEEDDSGFTRSLNDSMRRMELMGGNGVRSAKTDASGKYRLDQLPDKSFRIIARSRDYDLAEIGPLESGDPVDDLVLVEFGRIEGHVVDAITSAPVQKFHITLARAQESADGERSYQRDWYRQDREEQEDLEGRFEYARLSAGSYRLQVTAEDYAPSLVEVEVLGGEVQTTRIALGHGARVEGRVVDAESGEAIPGATLQLLRSNDDSLGLKIASDLSAHTDEEGHFRVGAVPDGDFVLSVSHPEFYQDEKAGRIEFSVPFDVAPEISIGLRKAGRVQGQVERLAELDETGQYYQITLRPKASEDDEAGQSGTTGSSYMQDDGNFTVNSLRPGRYEVLVNRQSFVFDPEKGARDTSTEAVSIGEVVVGVGKVEQFTALAPEELRR